MKTLAQLEKEAQSQNDAINNPRLFLAIFPAGPKNGHFLDPWMGLVQIKGMDGFITMNQLGGGYDIQADWAD